LGGNSKTEIFEREKDFLPTLDYIPLPILETRRKWIALHDDEEYLASITDADVVDMLVELVNLDVGCTVQRLKVSNIEESFGCNPFNNPSTLVEVTPNLSYHLTPGTHDSRDQQYFGLPKRKQSGLGLSARIRNSIHGSVQPRSPYDCPTCFRRLLFTPDDVLRHQSVCSQETS
jgi:hypothetical protein